MKLQNKAASETIGKTPKLKPVLPACYRECVAKAVVLLTEKHSDTYQILDAIKEGCHKKHAYAPQIIDHLRDRVGMTLTSFERQFDWKTQVALLREFV